MEGHSTRCICLLCVLRRASKPHKLVVPCKFNLLNSCKFSCDECRFTHYEFDEIPPCRYGVNCRLGPTKCLFLHESVEGDGTVDENLPQSNPEQSADEQPAVTEKKKRRKKKKKKNNNKSRLVESKQDSQSTQNQFQPLTKELDDTTDSDSGSESDDSSTCETNHLSALPVDIVNTPSTENYSNIEEVASAPTTTQDTLEADESKEVEEGVVEDFSPVPLTAAACPNLASTSPDMVEVSAQQTPVTITHARFFSYRNKTGKPALNVICATCNYDMQKFWYLNTRGIPTRNYVQGNLCSECGVVFQQQDYWKHSQIYRVRCEYKDKGLLFCEDCCVRLSIPNPKVHA